MSVVAIYARKSKFTGKGESIDTQITLCKEHAERVLPSSEINDYIIYKDEGFSGGSTKRPDYQRMLIDAENGKFSNLICYKLDRVSRSVLDFSNLFEKLQQLNINFVCVKENFDTNTPAGRAMLGMSSVFAQLEREMISERIRDNMLQLAKTGRWLGGMTPTGFKSELLTYIDEGYKERKLYKLSPITEELELIKLIYSKYLELRSLSKVERYLLSNNIKTKTNKEWSKNKIQFILQNPVYVKSTAEVADYLGKQGMTVIGDLDSLHGFLTYNKRKNKDGPYNNIESWVCAVAKHEGVIEGADWLKVQLLLKENKQTAPRRDRSTEECPALLSGIIRCAECGSTMRVVYGVKDTQGITRKHYYRCRLKADSGLTRCNCANAPGKDIDSAVINKLKLILTLDKNSFLNELKLLKSKYKLQDNIDNEIDLINQKIQQEEIDKKNYMKKLAQFSDINSELAKEYEKMIIESLEEEKRLKTKLNELHDSKKKSDFNILNIDLLTESLQKFNEVIDTCSSEEKRILLKNILDAIYWNGETGDVEIRFSGMGKKN
jgi:site-specific DNA recombinase